MSPDPRETTAQPTPVIKEASVQHKQAFDAKASWQMKNLITTYETSATEVLKTNPSDTDASELKTTLDQYYESFALKEASTKTAEELKQKVDATPTHGTSDLLALATQEYKISENQRAEVARALEIAEKKVVEKLINNNVVDGEADTIARNYLAEAFEQANNHIDRELIPIIAAGQERFTKEMLRREQIRQDITARAQSYLDRAGETPKTKGLTEILANPNSSLHEKVALIEKWEWEFKMTDSSFANPLKGVRHYGNRGAESTGKDTALLDIEGLTDMIEQVRSGSTLIDIVSTGRTANPNLGRDIVERSNPTLPDLTAEAVQAFAAVQGLQEQKFGLKADDESNPSKREKSLFKATLQNCVTTYRVLRAQQSAKAALAHSQECSRLEKKLAELHQTIQAGKARKNGSASKS